MVEQENVTSIPGFRHANGKYSPTVHLIGTGPNGQPYRRTVELVDSDCRSVEEALNIAARAVEVIGRMGKARHLPRVIAPFSHAGQVGILYRVGATFAAGGGRVPDRWALFFGREAHLAFPVEPGDDSPDGVADAVRRARAAIDQGDFAAGD